MTTNNNNYETSWNVISVRNRAHMPYSQLATYGYNVPLFEPNLINRCLDGSYMNTSDPLVMAYCKSIPKETLERISCNKASNGKPLRMQYTSPSYMLGPTSCYKFDGCRQFH